MHVVVYAGKLGVEEVQVVELHWVDNLKPLHSLEKGLESAVAGRLISKNKEIVRVGQVEAERVLSFMKDCLFSQILNREKRLLVDCFPLQSLDF